MSDPNDVTLTPAQLHAHWQGHRGLTRKVIEAFPEEALFNHSVGGMRPFATLTMEFLRMSVPTLRGMVTRAWESSEVPQATTKAELLAAWDRDTEEIEQLWPRIPVGRFQERDTAFGQWEGPVYGTFLYIVDNEIHHRGQGYVYLRSLGIEPPAFWER